MNASSHDSRVILLHGVGASGSELAPLGDALRPHLPHTRFATPDAPGRSEHGPGRQWFSVAGVSKANRPQRVEAARAEFDRVLNAQISGLGFSDRLDRVALVGDVRRHFVNLTVPQAVSQRSESCETWPSSNKAFAEAFGEHKPARSVVPIQALHHGYLIEIDGVVLEPSGVARLRGSDFMNADDFFLNKPNAGPDSPPIAWTSP